ncbi:MFS transporter [Spirosoma fluminis]
MDRRLILIFAITLLDIIAANGLGVMVTKFVVALPNKPVLLTAGTALMLGIQLALSPAIGHLSDKIGRRPVVIGTTIASLMSSLFLLPVQAWGYVVNRAAKGGTNGLYAVMRSSVADITEGKELIKYSSLLSFLVGSSIVVGPLLTGLILVVSAEARIDAMPMVLFLIGVGTLNILLAFFFKETSDNCEKVDVGELTDKVVKSLKVSELWRKLDEADKQVPGIKAIFILNMLGTLGFGYYNFFIAFLTQSDLNMSPVEVAHFFMYFGTLSVVANLIFFRYFVDRVDKQKAVILIAGVNIGLQILYMFSESSVTLLYVVGGVDALTVSLIGGLIGGVLTEITKAGGGQGEMFGNIQALGGLASFATALVNSLLSGVNMKAPFIFCAICSGIVIWWSRRLPDKTKKYTGKQKDSPQQAPANA